MDVLEVDVIHVMAGWDTSLIFIMHPTEHERRSFLMRVLLPFSGVGGFNLMLDVFVIAAVLLVCPASSNLKAIYCSVANIKRVECRITSLHWNNIGADVIAKSLCDVILRFA